MPRSPTDTKGVWFCFWILPWQNNKVGYIIGEGLDLLVEWRQSGQIRVHVSMLVKEIRPMTTKDKRGRNIRSLDVSNSFIFPPENVNQAE